MTEDEWFACADPDAMLTFLRTTETFRTRWQGPVVYPRFRVSDRKLGLWALGCCRRAWPVILPAVRDVAPRLDDYLDGLCDGAEMSRVVVDALNAIPHGTSEQTLIAHTAISHLVAAPAACAGRIAPVVAEIRGTHVFAERARQADLLLCVVGNPLRPVALNRSWLTADVVALTRTAYDHREFDRLPVLADALREASCVEEALLAHCQGGGEHVRGCWALDLLLSKE